MIGILDHTTYLLRNLYAGKEVAVTTLYETSDWFKTRKGVQKGCILSPCLFKLYVQHIMQNAGLDEPQARIMIAGRNINSLREADDTTLMAENDGEVKSLLMRMKEESEKALKKAKIMAFGPITSWQIEGGKVEIVRDFWDPNSLQMLTASMKLKDTSYSLEEKLWQT